MSLKGQNVINKCWTGSQKNKKKKSYTVVVKNDGHIHYNKRPQKGSLFPFHGCSTMLNPKSREFCRLLSLTNLFLTTLQPSAQSNLIELIISCGLFQA